VGPNKLLDDGQARSQPFQSSVRINVGPNAFMLPAGSVGTEFQSSVRINVGPNSIKTDAPECDGNVSILRED